MVPWWNLWLEAVPVPSRRVVSPVVLSFPCLALFCLVLWLPCLVIVLSCDCLILYCDYLVFWLSNLVLWLSCLFLWVQTNCIFWILHEATTLILSPSLSLCGGGIRWCYSNTQTRNCGLGEVRERGRTQSKCLWSIFHFRFCVCRNWS